MMAHSCPRRMYNLISSLLLYHIMFLAKCPTFIIKFHIFHPFFALFLDIITFFSEYFLFVNFLSFQQKGCCVRDTNTTTFFISLIQETAGNLHRLFPVVFIILILHLLLQRYLHQVRIHFLK
jgi:cellulose synthase/poly-beta-1,6-N-acetylglucosamine synthase-like glycosyltransferase